MDLFKETIGKGCPLLPLRVKSLFVSYVSYFPGQGSVLVYESQIILDSKLELTSSAAPLHPQCPWDQGFQSTPVSFTLSIIKTEPVSQAQGRLQALWYLTGVAA